MAKAESYTQVGKYTKANGKMINFMDTAFITMWTGPHTRESGLMTLITGTVFRSGAMAIFIMGN